MNTLNQYCLNTQAKFEEIKASDPKYSTLQFEIVNESNIRKVFLISCSICEEGEPVKQTLIGHITTYEENQREILAEVKTYMETHPTYPYAFNLCAQHSEAYDYYVIFSDIDLSEELWHEDFYMEDFVNGRTMFLCSCFLANGHLDVECEMDEALELCDSHNLSDNYDTAEETNVEMTELSDDD